MAKLKYKNGSNWTEIGANGRHICTLQDGKVTISNNVYGTPTGSTSLDATYESQGILKPEFTFSNLRGAPGGTGPVGNTGPSGHCFYYLSIYATSATTIYNATADNLSNMRISCTGTLASGYAAGLSSLPTTYLYNYSGSLRVNSGGVLKSGILGLGGQIATTNGDTQEAQGAGFKAGITYGSTYTATTGYVDGHNITQFYNSWYSMNYSFPERILQTFPTSTTYYALAARRSNGSSALQTLITYGNTHLNAKIYGYSTT